MVLAERADVTCLNKDNCTALHCDIIKELLTSNADINAKDTKKHLYILEHALDLKMQ